MSRKRITGIMLSILVAILLFFNLQQDATASRLKATNWTDTEMSLTELLDGGWKLIGHSTNRATTFNVAGGFVWDTQIYTFILNKENKYVFCYVKDPKTPQAETAGCRGLN
jgi:hypothetical protein